MICRAASPFGSRSRQFERSTALDGAILGVSILLIILSVILITFVLLHKSRGGGLSDLFGGGMTTGMSGTSVAERNLDRLTIAVTVMWLLTIVALLLLYRFR